MHRLDVFLFFAFLILPLQTSSQSSNETESVNPKTKTRFIDKVRAIGRKQAIGVRGKLFCGRVPIRNATIKLWDNDLFDPDDLIAEKTVNQDGNFEIEGFAISITTIDPQLRIYHSCGAENDNKCRRKITLTIPDYYINKGIEVTKWFELGSVNMEFRIKHKEEPHCY